MAHPPLRFGAFLIDADAYRLTRGTTAIELAPKAFDLLLLLARQPGRLVTKDDILAAIWPDVAVTDNALTQVVSDLRQALGDSPSAPKFIETVHRRGYRFVGEIQGSQGSQGPQSFLGPQGPRETASLDAYRALTEGRLKLESLDPVEIPAAIAAFERALALDPQYALAHVGLAHARFWQFQGTRSRIRPDIAALTAAVAHATRAIELDPEMAEAHSAIGLFLASAERRDDGVAACRRAVTLEPGNWRHQFRLGMAAWGEERLSWLAAVTAQYPALSYAYFGRAMVYVARGTLDRAEQVLREGVANERRASEGAERFPASGLHWLLGLVRLAQGDAPGARVAFDRELQSPGNRLFADEYMRDAWTGHGCALLAGGDHTGAVGVFERVLAETPDHPRAIIGLAEAQRRLGARRKAEAAAGTLRQTIEDLRAGGRLGDAGIITALGLAAAGRGQDATATLEQLLRTAPPGSTGWMLPIEPTLAPLRGDPGHAAVLAQVATRAC